MAAFSFHQASLAVKVPFAFTPSIFHNPSHLKLQRPTGWKWFYAVDQKRGKVAASFYVNIERDEANSAPRSPYGTIESTDGFPAESLFEMTIFIQERLRRLKVKALRIKTPPREYQVDRSEILYATLINQGFIVANAEIGSVLSTQADFVSGLNQFEHRKLKRSARSNLQFRQIALTQLDRVFEFILACHTSKGYQISMSLGDLRKTVKEFPANYLLFGVHLEGELIAAAILVRVTKSVLYLYKADHNAKYDSLSPVVTLVGGIHSYCQDHKIPKLDLGTSAVGGKPNFGLLAFKQGLGAQQTLKLTFQKLLGS